MHTLERTVQAYLSTYRSLKEDKILTVAMNVTEEASWSKLAFAFDVHLYIQVYEDRLNRRYTTAKNINEDNQGCTMDIRRQTKFSVRDRRKIVHQTRVVDDPPFPKYNFHLNVELYCREITSLCPTRRTVIVESVV